MVVGLKEDRVVCQRSTRRSVNRIIELRPRRCPTLSANVPVVKKCAIPLLPGVGFVPSCSSSSGGSSSSARGQPCLSRALVMVIPGVECCKTFQDGGGSSCRLHPSLHRSFKFRFFLGFFYLKKCTQDFHNHHAVSNAYTMRIQSREQENAVAGAMCSTLQNL